MQKACDGSHAQALITKRLNIFAEKARCNLKLRDSWWCFFGFNGKILPRGRQLRQKMLRIHPSIIENGGLLL